LLHAIVCPYNDSLTKKQLDRRIKNRKKLLFDFNIALRVLLIVLKPSPNLVMTDDGTSEIVVRDHVNDSCFSYTNYFKAASSFPKHSCSSANQPVMSALLAKHFSYQNVPQAHDLCTQEPIQCSGAKTQAAM
jgi:hypothetical protein